MPTFGAPHYSPEVRAKALELIQSLRPRIVLPNNALKGMRFNDDDRIMWELESTAVESKFLEDPAFHVGRALVESARSDYWYTYEKRWDDDYDYYDNEDEDNYVEE